MANARFKSPGGTHDVFPPGVQQAQSTSDVKWVEDITKWHWFESVARDVCRRFGYDEIRTPAYEAPDLFRRAVGEGTDIVNKEMYDVVTDKSRDRFTLRPEGTAPVVRAYLEHRLDLNRPVHKLFYLASIFRHEREQKGRYRQHHQFGVEVIGAAGPDVDAEIISLAMAVLGGLGVTRLTLKVNSVGTPESRARYVERLRAFAEPLLPEMSEDNQRRFRENALRMLDSKSARDQELLADAPKITDFLDDESRAHFDVLQGYLTELGVSYEIDPKLVRGFDYYTRTAFEVQSPDVGAQSALAGGGRYDRLVEDLGGPPTPGMGFGMGIERVLIALQAANMQTPEAPALDAFLCPLGAAARGAAVPLLAKLRAAGLAADMDYTGRRLKAMFEQADLTRARYCVILGDDEIAKGVAQVRAMRAEGKPQTEVPLDTLVERLQA